MNEEMTPLDKAHIALRPASALDGPRRRRFLGQSVSALALWGLGGLGFGVRPRAWANAFEPLVVDNATWRAWLSDAAYEVLRDEGTEPPRSSPLDSLDDPGTYVCAGCFLPLFSAEHKYDSGTGWPSFWRPLNEAHIDTKKDFKLIWPRTEYHCARCKGHQGHVFGDGPEPTGQRWCNNGVALRFIPAGETLPALRQAPQSS